MLKYLLFTGKEVGVFGAPFAAKVPLPVLNSQLLLESQKFINSGSFCTFSTLIRFIGSSRVIVARLTYYNKNVLSQFKISLLSYKIIECFKKLKLHFKPSQTCCVTAPNRH
jgi:hypothetical protein